MQNFIIKYLTNQASRYELDKLADWIKEPKNLKLFDDFVKTNYAINFNMKTYNAAKVKKHLLNIINDEKKAHGIVRIKKRAFKYAVAASLVLLIAITFLFKNNSDKVVMSDDIIANTIKIGSDKAILTLANGSEIVLDSTTAYHDKKITGTGKEIIYKVAGAKINIVEYNYLTIPRGGQYHVVLSDGTNIWLNSESQLKYPVSFMGGKPREVELVYGEAYLEVSKSTNHNGDAFVLKTNEQSIEVLGTMFNVKSYKDDTAILTTLVEGSVSVNNNISKNILKPGEQSRLSQAKNEFEVTTVDVNEVISWREGEFSFTKRPLVDMMKVLSRWYDIDIIIANEDLKNICFTGVLSKQQHIENILEIIKNTNNLNYKIDENKITIK